MRARLLAIGVVTAVALSFGAPAPARAEQFDLIRMVQSSALDRGSFVAFYDAEVQRGLATVVKGTGDGGGGGGGLGGQRDYRGVQHHLTAYYAPLSWLSFGVRQTVNQPDYSQFQYGVLYPEARFRLPLLRRFGVETSAFTGSRVRIHARRASTMVAGVGAERRFGRAALAADVAFETSLAEDNRENGLRYEAGASFDLVGPLSAALEAWGAAVWPDNAVFQYSIHAGPTLKVRLKRFWAAFNFGAGVKDRPNKTFYDYSCLGQVGFAL